MTLFTVEQITIKPIVLLFKKSNYFPALQFVKILSGKFITGLLTGFLFLSMSFSVFAQDIPVPARPNPPRLVNDFADLLSQAENNALEQKLVAYDDSTSTQIAIVIVRTVGDYAMVNYAVAIGQKWGVGGKKFDNGIVILVASEDHKAFIATGYGLEGAIPDITAGQIIDHDIIPNFKYEDYYKGLDLATSDLIKAAAGEYKASSRGQKNKGSSGAIFFVIFILIIIFVIFMSSRGGGGNDHDDGDGYNRRGRGYGLGPFLGGMFLGGMLGGGFRGGGGGFGGGGGGGFGGGGFGGFGGGGFGGGGAGGGW